MPLKCNYLYWMKKLTTPIIKSSTAPYLINQLDQGFHKSILDTDSLFNAYVNKQLERFVIDQLVSI